MAVLVPGKFVYLATPHTGSMSTTTALLEQVPGAQTLGEHHSTRAELGLEDLEGVTTVRNPFDMIATWWLRTDAKWNYESFSDFLRDYDHPTYVRDGRIFYHCEPGVHVLRFERLQEDLDEYLARHGLGPLPLPRINRTVDRDPWPDYYDPECLEIVWERFGKEALEHGYSKPA